MQLTPDVITLLSAATTPMISDAMDRIGISSGVLPSAIQSIPASTDVHCFGFAFPCRVVPTDEYVEIHTLLEMIDAVPADSIVCVAADADIDAALWGGLMSARSQARGARGAVVNGGVRDVAQIAALGFRVFGEYRCVKDIRRRGFMAEYNVAVSFGAIKIAPGDFVLADANGVVVISQQDFPKVLEELNTVLDGENRTASALTDGQSAVEVFKQFEVF